MKSGFAGLGLEGGIGIFGLGRFLVWLFNFCSYKLWCLGVLCGLWVLCNLVFGFRCFVNNNAVSGFAKEVTLCNHMPKL